MFIHDLYSRRQKLAQGEMPDVYVYESLPEKLRRQIVYLFRDTLNDDVVSQCCDNDFYEYIVEVLCREYGKAILANYHQWELMKERNYSTELDIFILNEGNSSVEQVLDVIELFYKKLNRLEIFFIEPAVDNFTKILNIRFRDNDVGYSLENGKIIRIDSEFNHAEIVKPALSLLRNKDYKVVQDEFLKAHEHYRKGNKKEALNECSKSLESMVKSIFIKRKWNLESNKSCNLFKSCINKGLIPNFFESGGGNLEKMFCMTLAARNEMSGHSNVTESVGDGAIKSIDVPDHVLRYVLNMTASAIVFLAEANDIYVTPAKISSKCS